MTFTFREFEVPVTEGTARLKAKNKRLINRARGVGFDIPGGITWAEICRSFLKDGTNPKLLSRVARGHLKSTNGWEVEILSD